MSYTIETKKRKFHRVLESISNPVPNDGASKPANPATSVGRHISELPLKRARLSSGSVSQAAPLRSRSLRSIQPHSSPSATSSRPSFVPWDRERFLKRLETFRRVDRWSPKPAAINEVEWAKRGWICTDVMRVSCVGDCGGSVIVKLPDEIDELDGYDDVETVHERKRVRAYYHAGC